MNKLMVLALGLGIAFGSFAQDKPMTDDKSSTSTTKKAKKAKKSSKKMDSSSTSTDAKPKM